MYLIPVTHRTPSPAFGRSLDALFGTRTRQANPDEQRRTPAIDVVESDAAYTVVADLPGVTRDQVKVSVHGRRVEIEAAAEAAPQLPEGQKLVYGERAQARYSRTLSLPVEVDSANSVAKLDNGVLTLTLNKKVSTAATQINVQ